MMCALTGIVVVAKRNKFSVGETIEVMKPNGENLSVTVRRIVNEGHPLGAGLGNNRFD